MYHKTLYRIVLAAAVFALSIFFFTQPSVVSAAAEGRGGPGGPNGRGVDGAQPGQGWVAGGGYALTPLSAEEQTALQHAILEEYGALNLYQSVITQLGNVYPFSQIARSEQQHIDALVRQAQKYGVTVPANPGLAQPATFEILAEACQAGVNAEIADADLYDTVKPVTTHADLLRVYDRLQSSSLNSHLIAFQSCD